MRAGPPSSWEFMLLRPAGISAASMSPRMAVAVEVVISWPCRVSVFGAAPAGEGSGQWSERGCATGYNTEGSLEDAPEGGVAGRARC